MILTSTDLVNIFKEKPNAATLEDARKDSKHFTAHITGQGNDNLIEKITGLESDAQLTLRKKYGRSNRDVFQRIHEPTHKIFAAKGTSRYYELPESAKRVFISKLNNIYNGLSLPKWVEDIALQYYRIDPMGLIFMEVGDNETYPTYKSTSKIFDYKLKGRSVEYVIFNTNENDIFRVVDDVTDKLVKYDGTSVTEVFGQTYPNYFGKVPATIISDILKPNSKYYTSPDYNLIEIADEFLRESTVKSVFKLKFGYPRQWQYASTCTNCKGTGQKSGEDCPSCNGSGKAVNSDVSEVMVLPIPSTEQPTIAPNVAGYISPDVQGWDKMTEELSLLENLMYKTEWNIEPVQKTQGIIETKTATEIVSDMQPMHDRLIRYSKWACDIEKFVTDLTGIFYYPSTFKGSSINYSHRYVLEGPDVIWKKYEDARAKGSPTIALDDLLAEYYYSKYASDTMELTKYIKLMKVEPFIHLTISEAKNVVTNPADYNRKIYYSEWINQLPENDVILKSAVELNKSLTEYANTKEIITPETVIK